MMRGMVCAAQPEAVEAGAEVLASGGDAVDAAVATALTQTAVDPQMCGIAGFGSMHVYRPGGAHVCLDFYARAPLAAAPDMWLDRLVAETEDGFGFILSGRENELGYGAIATPMTLQGLATALEKFGTRKLADLIAPAIQYAETGFMVRPHVAAYWNQVPTEGRAPHAEFLTRLAPTRKIYARPDGRLHAVGDTLINRDMAATLRRIASAGVEDFYRGDIAAKISADMKANNALLSAADLAACQVEEAKPLWGSYRGFRIATNPPPGGGLAAILRPR